MDHVAENDEIHRLRSRFIPQGHTSLHPRYVASASGAVIRDVEGREYIDFAGGIGVMNVGHSHPKVVAAIQDQAAKFTHTCFMVLPYEPAVSLAEKLCAVAPVPAPSMALFINSGAEAVENAVKIARYSTKRTAIIACENAYHGRTLLTMSLTSKVKPYKFGFGPFAPEIYHVPYAYCYRCSFGLTYPGCGVACADHLKNFFINHVASETVAALIAEPVQGEGGFMTPPPEYFPKVAKICKENGILFIADEIQSGMGRAGRWFAIEDENVVPDIVLSAKSLGGGLPISAVTGRVKLMDSVHVGGLGGTYGGNPVAAAVALAVLDKIETEGLLDRSRSVGATIEGRLRGYQDRFGAVGNVRGRGAMRAMELVADRDTKEPLDGATMNALARSALERGVIVLTAGTYGNVVRLLPPITIDDGLLDEGLDLLEEAFAATTG